LTLIPIPRRFCAALAPAFAAAAAGFADSPICSSESSGAPGTRRTWPPSWSVISSSGVRTGFSGLASACSSSATTLVSCARLETFWLKKITPAASP
jgi:hypothetical protein